MKRFLPFLFPLLLISVSCSNKDTPPGPEDRTLPTVETLEITDITRSSAMGGGNVIDDGNAEVTERGVCWSAHSEPTTEDHKTLDGTGIGSFTSDISGLEEVETYYIRAYATNSEGTAYGKQLTITTKSNPDLLNLKAGTLNAVINEHYHTGLTELKLGGQINEIDIIFLRTAMKSIKDLDLSETEIVENPAANPTTEKDKIPVKGFYAMANLEKFVFPRNITKIGDEAFMDCTGLSGKIIIPETVNYLGDRVFHNCSSLEEAVLPPAIEYIGEELFYQDISLKRVTLPTRLKEVSYRAFAGCSELETISLPESLTAVGAEAFSGCSGLKGNLVIPSSVKEIGNSAFNRCSSDGKLNLNEGLVSIGNLAFYNAKFAGDLIIPESVQVLGEYAFSSARLDGDLVIKSTLTHIEKHAFSYTNFKEITIPANIKIIGESAFTFCGSLEKVNFTTGLEEIGRGAFGTCGLKGDLIIPEGVTKIGSGAFSYCEEMDGLVVLPQSLESIGSSVFNMCDAITGVQVSWTTPIEYGRDMIPNGKTIFVPTGTRTVYEAANGWKDHPIVEY